jgi:carboxylate-amine ligase
MSEKQPSFTVGIEEEYLLVDRDSRDLASDPPPTLLTDCEKRLEGQVSPELLRSQIEVGTRVAKTISEAHADLAHLRRVVVEVAEQHGYGVIAASTHPFARWLEQKHTARERYEEITREMQAAARRLVICGMHVHVGIDDDELRIDLMNQFSYFLPHLLALSCSSPFWGGENTGLKSYRLTVFDVKAGLIEDATKIWWDLRPSDRYPTLEMRVSDVCTLLEDAVCIAAFTVATMRMLYRLGCQNKRWRRYARMLVQENRWRAMRYSFDEGLVDFAKGKVVPVTELIEELIEMIEEDASELGCLDDVLKVRRIFERGTSAHRQVRVYEDALAAGSSTEDALKAVVDKLIEETASGL